LRESAKQRLVGAAAEQVKMGVATGGGRRVLQDCGDEVGAFLTFEAAAENDLKRSVGGTIERAPLARGRKAVEDQGRRMGRSRGAGVLAESAEGGERRG